MIVTRKLLSEFLNLKNISNQKIVTDLTELGFETNILYDWAQRNQGIKFVKVVNFVSHSELKKLRIVEIDDEKFQYKVICGAQNFSQNDYVIWAPPGTMLANGLKIKKRKFIETVSEGMLCSWPELGLSENESDEGIVAISSQNSIFSSIQIGDENPLRYFGYDDTIFDVDVLPGNTEFQNIYGLAKYLSSLWQISLTTHQSSSDQFTKNTKIAPVPNRIQSLFSFEFNLSFQLPLWLKSFQKHYQQKFSDPRELLINYLEVLYGVKLKLFSFTEAIQSASFDKKNIIVNKQILNSFSKQDLFTVVEANNLSASELPSADNYQLALQHLMQILEKEFNVKNITLWSHLFQSRKSDVLVIDLMFLHKIIGVPFTISELKTLLTPLGFVLNSLSEKKVEFICPNNQKIRDSHEIAEEIVRMYKISRLPEVPIEFSKSPIRIDNNLDLINRLRNYLIYQGLKEVKILFNISNSTFQNNLSSNKFKVQEILPQSLVPQLKDIANQENIFTFDTIFLKTESKIEEKQYLTIVWSSPLLVSFLKKSQINVHRAYLITLLKNILNLWNLPTKNLIQKHNLHNTQSKFPTKVLSEQLFSKTGTDEIHYNDSFLAWMGVINSFKQEKKISTFYLEIDISVLLKTASRFREQSFVCKPQEKLIYRDFSLRYSEFISHQVILKTKNNSQIHYSFYDLLFRELKTLDKEIVKLELIDNYQNQVLTWRFWKVFKPEIKKNKSDWFVELTDELSKLKNVKIV